MEREKHCWAQVDLDAIRHNFQLVKKASGGNICAVVKADAYGHGDAAVARVLEAEGAFAFGVSCLAEALSLRRAGVSRPVLILGHTQPDHAALLAENHLWQTVYSAEYAQALSAAATAAGVKVECHLKLDTGMGRLGFGLRCSEDLESCVAEVLPYLSLPGLAFTGVFMHFAVADSLDDGDIAYTHQQYRLFRLAVDRLEALGHSFQVVHCCNSAASFTHPEWKEDMVRPGIVLYGCQPSDDTTLPGLQPALSLRTVVTQVKALQPGQSVSYGRTFTAPHAMTVAVLAAGYADGYPRSLSGQGLVLIRGVACPVLGRVCMDQMMVDVSAASGVARGDEAVLFGAGGAQSTAQAAALCGTIPYELLCRVSRRVPRLYVQQGKTPFFANYLE